MNTIKIGIVEDEMIIAETIILALQKLGYEIVGAAGKYDEAIEMITNNTPDLVLLDINLGSKKDGIDLALEIKNRFDIPIIFLTANSDPATISRAKEINPLAFVVKPFSQNNLFSAIEIGWSNYSTNLLNLSTTVKHVVLKVGNTLEKIQLIDILYIKNDLNYMDVYLVSDKKFTVRYTTNEIMALLPCKKFVKINRTYILNIQHITKLESKIVYLAQQEFSISKRVRDEFISKM